jgi:hypothetical protein
MRSRASALTAVTARNGFLFLLRAIASPESECSATWFRCILLCGIISELREKSREEMDEREFFDEKPEKKPATLNCPHCHQSGDYEVTWLVRTKKRQLSGRADERDRARFAKARSYMMRKDDVMGCKNVRCRKRFEISGLQSVVFTE